MFNIYRTALSNKIPALLNPHTIPLPSTLQFPHSSRKINEPPQQPKGGKKDEEKKGKGKKGDNDGEGGMLEPILEDLRGWLGRKRKVPGV